jgi:hypothetical protein
LDQSQFAIVTGHVSRGGTSSFCGTQIRLLFANEFECGLADASGTDAATYR